jgi:hypothetical protein
MNEREDKRTIRTTTTLAEFAEHIGRPEASEAELLIAWLSGDHKEQPDG